jgi:hypothetical protein
MIFLELSISSVVSKLSLGGAVNYSYMEALPVLLASKSVSYPDVIKAGG